MTESKSHNWERVDDKNDGFGASHLIKLPEEFEVSEYSAFDEGGCTEYIVISIGNPHIVCEETFAFPADEEGEIISWLELPGSKRGTVDWKSVADDVADNILKNEEEVEK